MTRIAINVNDCRQLAEITCDIDFANAAGDKSAVTTLISKMHNTIEQMAGVHADKIYAPDEHHDAEYEPKN